MIVGLLGYTVEGAWDLTPAEMHTCMDAIKARRRDSAEWALWIMAAPRIQTLPTLEQMAGDESATDTIRPMTAEEKAELRAHFERIYPGRFTWPESLSS